MHTPIFYQKFCQPNVFFWWLEAGRYRISGVVPRARPPAAVEWYVHERVTHHPLLRRLTVVCVSCSKETKGTQQRSSHPSPATTSATTSLFNAHPPSSQGNPAFWSHSFVVPCLADLRCLLPWAPDPPLENPRGHAGPSRRFRFYVHPISVVC